MTAAILTHIATQAQVLSEFAEKNGEHPYIKLHQIENKADMPPEFSFVNRIAALYANMRQYFFALKSESFLAHSFGIYNLCKDTEQELVDLLRQPLPFFERPSIWLNDEAAMDWEGGPDLELRAFVPRFRAIQQFATRVLTASQVGSTEEDVVSPMVVSPTAGAVPENIHVYDLTRKMPRPSKDLCANMPKSLIYPLLLEAAKQGEVSWVQAYCKALGEGIDPELFGKIAKEAAAVQQWETLCCLLHFSVALSGSAISDLLSSCIGTAPCGVIQAILASESPSDPISLENLTLDFNKAVQMGRVDHVSVLALHSPPPALTLMQTEKLLGSLYKDKHFATMLTVIHGFGSVDLSGYCLGGVIIAAAFCGDDEVLSYPFKNLGKVRQSDLERALFAALTFGRVQSATRTLSLMAVKLVDSSTLHNFTNKAVERNAQEIVKFLIANFPKQFSLKSLESLEKMAANSASLSSFLWNEIWQRRTKGAQ